MAAKPGVGEDAALLHAASLAAAARVATLATIEGGQPHASLVTPAFGPSGTLLLLLSSLAVHTRHLQGNSACCLLLAGAPGGENPQTTPRLSLSATASLADAATAAPVYLRVHPYAAGYERFTDFSYWRLNVEAAHYIGGFGAATHLDPAALQQAIIAIVG